MNDQQIDNLIAYLHEVASRHEGGEGRSGHELPGPSWSGCRTPQSALKQAQAGPRTDPAEKLKIESQVTELVGRGATNQEAEGAALFNMNCARCHTIGWSYGEPQRRGAARSARRSTTSSTSSRPSRTRSTSSPAARSSVRSTGARARPAVACPPSASCSPRTRSRPSSTTSASRSEGDALTCSTRPSPLSTSRTRPARRPRRRLRRRRAAGLDLPAARHQPRQPARLPRRRGRSHRLDDPHGLRLVHVRHRLQGHGPRLEGGEVVISSQDRRPSAAAAPEGPRPLDVARAGGRRPGAARRRRPRRAPSCGHQRRRVPSRPTPSSRSSTPGKRAAARRPSPSHNGIRFSGPRPHPPHYAIVQVQAVKKVKVPFGTPPPARRSTTRAAGRVGDPGARPRQAAAARRS